MFATTFAEIATRALRGRRSWRAYPKYGIAAVMRAALERRSASTMIIISIRWSLVGAHVDCSTNTSLPRTFSSSSTMISPSLNFDDGRLAELDVQVLGDLLRELRVRVAREHHQVVEGHRLDPARALRAKRLRKKWQGRKDSNPRMPESKSGALTNLATPLRPRPCEARVRSYSRSGWCVEPARDESVHRCRQLVHHALRGLRGSRTPRKRSRPSPSCRAVARARSHSRCSRTSGNRAATTPSRSLRNAPLSGCAEKSSILRGSVFRVNSGDANTDGVGNGHRRDQDHVPADRHLHGRQAARRCPRPTRCGRR